MLYNRSCLELLVFFIKQILLNTVEKSGNPNLHNIWNTFESWFKNKSIFTKLLGIGAILVSCLAFNNYVDEGRIVCIFTIVLGSIVFLVSFFGCCGAIKEDICLTWMYAACLLVLIIGNAVLLFGYISHIDGETKARKDVDLAWHSQLNGADAMSKIQVPLACCGKQNSSDYVNANLTIPSSCYMDCNVGNTTSLYPDGCLMKLIAVYEAAEHWVTIFSWSSFSVEMVAFISACVLGITFTNQQRRARY